ncbi:hypothetical protein BvCmsKKP061_05176 [Escherichia coli]|uniref:Uncharacterized protein n=1 Tax=Escherichia coli TaxID=562 RepID=A0A4D0PWI4_ECOLX|nr:hypothetical protein BvCmsKKP061_05176 [Escherichia coli]GDL55414.1 hypothetical protein BvCmsKSP045_00843 [Escherichia coli]
MPGLTSGLCIKIQLVFQRDRRILAADKIIITVIYPPQRAGPGKNHSIGVISHHQVFQRVFMIQVNITQHAILNVVLKQVDDFGIPGEKIGAFHYQIRPEQHSGFTVGGAVRLSENHLIAGHHCMPDTCCQR